MEIETRRRAMPKLIAAFVLALAMVLSMSP